MQNAVLVAHFLLATLCFWMILRLPVERLAWKTPHWLALGALAAAFEFVSFRATFPGEWFWDFVRCYLPAGDAVRSGDLGALTVLYERVVQGFVNMPVVAYLFAPFSLLEEWRAALLFTVLGLAATWSAWRALCITANLDLRGRLLLAVLFLANGPLINGIKFGNTSHFILLGLVLSLAWLLQGRSARAGAMLAVLGIMKPALGLFAVFFLLRRDWRALVGLGATGIAISMLSLLLFGLQYNVFWFETSILQFGRQWFSAFTVQSIPGFIARLQGDLALMTTWEPYAHGAGERMAGRFATLVLYVTAAVACWLAARRPEVAGTQAAQRRLVLQFVLTLCLCLDSSPLSWSHYYCWLLIPAAFFIDALSRRQAGPWLLWPGASALALGTPLIVWPASISNPLIEAAYRIVVSSHLLWSGLLCFVIVCAALVRSGRRTPAGGMA